MNESRVFVYLGSFNGFGGKRDKEQCFLSSSQTALRGVPFLFATYLSFFNEDYFRRSDGGSAMSYHV